VPLPSTNSEGSGCIAAGLRRVWRRASAGGRRYTYADCYEVKGGRCVSRPGTGTLGFSRFVSSCKFGCPTVSTYPAVSMAGRCRGGCVRARLAVAAGRTSPVLCFRLVHGEPHQALGQGAPVRCSMAQVAGSELPSRRASWSCSEAVRVRPHSRAARWGRRDPLVEFAQVVVIGQYRSSGRVARLLSFVAISARVPSFVWCRRGVRVRAASPAICYASVRA